jgi:hypothetical protein
MKRFDFAWLLALSPLAPLAAPLVKIVSSDNEMPVAYISAEYPEFAPAAGNVLLRLNMPGVYEWAYNRPALGESAVEVEHSVEEMMLHAANNGYAVRIMSSVDNLLADLKGAVTK